MIRGDGFLQRAVTLRAIAIDWPYLHAVLARIAHQLRGRVEAHRLRVQTQTRRRRAGNAVRVSPRGMRTEKTTARSDTSRPAHSQRNRWDGSS